jgi:hypothetical protein
LRPSGVWDDLFDSDFVRHDLNPKDGQGRAQNEAFIRRMRAAFLDLHFTDDVRTSAIALGFPPTGKKVAYSGMLIQRFANGKIVEQWTEANLLSLFQQLGLIPPLR